MDVRVNHAAARDPQILRRRLRHGLTLHQAEVIAPLQLAEAYSVPGLPPEGAA